MFILRKTRQTLRGVYAERGKADSSLHSNSEGLGMTGALFQGLRATLSKHTTNKDDFIVLKSLLDAPSPNWQHPAGGLQPTC